MGVGVVVEVVDGDGRGHFRSSKVLRRVILILQLVNSLFEFLFLYRFYILSALV